MKKFYILLVFTVLTLLSNSTFAQFTTSNSAPYNSPFYLINDVFAGGNVTISNVVAYGSASQYGFFTGNTTIGLDSGVVLSTGTINELCNGLCPNASTTPAPPGTANGVNFGFPWMGATTGATTNNNLFNVSASVPGLLGFGSAPNDVNDAAVISFDFVPTLDTMHFKFVFASKEWPTYPCSSFNDVFGFFVSGPGINGGFNSPVGYPNGAENYALIPGTSIPITITSINGPNHKGSCTNASYPQYFVPNVATASGMTAHYTTVMEVEFVVQPCQTYNFTMGIADGSDGALSSFVLMDANSFTSTGVQVAFNASYNLGGDSILYEGCGSVDMSVVRSDNIQNADTIHFNISGNATNGVDYTLLPDSVIFQPGQTSFTHNFLVPNDYIIEGPETIMVFVTDTDLVTCTGTGDTLLIVIQDPLPLLSDAWIDTINCAETGALATDASGLSPFTYQWSTGDTTDTILINPAPLVTTDYYVTITDACSIYTKIDTGTIVIQNPVVSINLADDTVRCDEWGAYAQLSHTVTPFNATFYNSVQYMWNNGNPSGLQMVPFPMAPAPKMDTSIFVTVTQGCSNQSILDTFTITVDNPPFSVSMNDDTINCTDPGALMIANVTPDYNNMDGSTPTYDYLWSTGHNWNVHPMVTPTVTTTYTFTATDKCRVRSITDSATIYVINDPVTGFALNKTVPCVGDSVTIAAVANGGYQPYTYLWNTGQTDSAIIVTGDSAVTTYTVSITDICNLDTTVVTADVILATYPNLMISPIQGDVFNCPHNPISLSGADVIGGSGDYVVSWNNWQTTDDYIVGIIDSTTTFTVQAVDICTGDSATQSVTFYVNEHDPLTISLPADTHICPDDLITLLPTTTGGAGGNVFKWDNGVDGPKLTSQSTIDQNYTVTVTDECGNTASTAITITVSNPMADFDHFFFDAFNVGFENRSDLASNYYWEFGDGDTSTAFAPLKTYEKSQTYNVRLIAYDSAGCTDTAYHKIVPPLVAFVPNAFTPNGDGLNDVFKVYGEGFKTDLGIKEFRIEIYDRWGKVIFSSKSAEFEWDGTINGQPAQIGEYVYVITIEGFEQQKIDMTGTVNIVK